MTVNKDPQGTFNATTTVTNNDLGVSAGQTRGSGGDLMSGSPNLENYLNEQDTEVVLNPGVYQMSSRVLVGGSARSSLRSAVDGEPIIIETDGGTDFGGSDNRWPVNIQCPQFWMQDVTFRSATQNMGEGSNLGILYSEGEMWIYNVTLEDSQYSVTGGFAGVRFGTNNTSASIHIDGYTATDGARQYNDTDSHDRDLIGISLPASDEGELLLENSEIAGWREHGIYGSDYLGPATIRNVRVENCTGSSLRVPPNGLPEVEGVISEYPNRRPSCYNCEVFIDDDVYQAGFACVPILSWDHGPRFISGIDITVRNTTKTNDRIVGIRGWRETHGGTFHNINIDMGQRASGTGAMGEEYICRGRESGPNLGGSDDYDGSPPDPWHFDDITVIAPNYTPPAVDIQGNGTAGSNDRDGSTVTNCCFEKPGVGVEADDASVTVEDSNINTDVIFSEVNGGSITSSNFTTDQQCSTEGSTVTYDLENSLMIEAQGSQEVDYSFQVNRGAVQAEESCETGSGEDSVSGTSASGTVGPTGDDTRDDYSFEGVITSFDVSNAENVNVYMNEVSVDPGQLNNSIVWDSPSDWDSQQSLTTIRHFPTDNTPNDEITMGYPSWDMGGSNLLAYCPADSEQAAATTVPEIINGNDGTAQNGTPFPGPGVMRPGGMFFDGSTHIEFPAFGVSGDSDFSFLCWAFPAIDNNDNTTIMYYGTNASREAHAVRTAGSDSFRYYNHNSNDAQTMNTDEWYGEWHMVAFAYDSDNSEVTVWFDDTQYNPISLGGDMDLGEVSIFLGYDPFSRTFAGVIDNPRWWDRPITQADIDRHYFPDVTAQYVSSKQ